MMADMNSLSFWAHVSLLPSEKGGRLSGIQEGYRADLRGFSDKMDEYVMATVKKIECSEITALGINSKKEKMKLLPGEFGNLVFTVDRKEYVKDFFSGKCFDIMEGRRMVGVGVVLGNER